VIRLGCVLASVLFLLFALSAFASGDGIAPVMIFGFAGCALAIYAVYMEDNE
jgi:hypothetical protein